MTFEFSGDLLERSSEQSFGELNLDENSVIVIEVATLLLIILTVQRSTSRLVHLIELGSR